MLLCLEEARTSGGHCGCKVAAPAARGEVRDAPASTNTAQDCTPSARHALMTRHAISARLAMSTRGAMPPSLPVCRGLRRPVAADAANTRQALARRLLARADHYASATLLALLSSAVCECADAVGARPLKRTRVQTARSGGERDSREPAALGDMTLRGAYGANTRPVAAE